MKSSTANQKKQLTVALFLGAGFSKSWGLPLASEIMNMESLRKKYFPGKWQRRLIDEIESLWKSTIDQHNGVVDEFGRLLHGSGGFHDFVTFIALRLSAGHWYVGTANETKWGTGDHVRKKKTIPREYHEFLTAFRAMKLGGTVTTNYDIVIEKLLGPLSSGRLSGFNYGITGEQLLGRHSVSSQWSYDPVTVTGRIPLLKLHGSLNWALSDGDQLGKYIDCRSSRGKRYEVVLLPPASGEMHEQLKPIWNHAHDVLGNSDAWVICGYSIPDYDHAIRKLFKSASGRVSKVCVCDVNPTPVCERISALLGEINPSVRVESSPGITRQFDSQAARKLRKFLMAA